MLCEHASRDTKNMDYKTVICTQLALMSFCENCSTAQRIFCNVLVEKIAHCYWCSIREHMYRN
jgi:hypothetical protein